ncbi:MAG: hypothetical protein FJ161_00150 [Gammaproteobacteria bacterium]|nr:hypothetical protein [Gammaproteobacteria bacterium]
MKKHSNLDFCHGGAVESKHHLRSEVQTESTTIDCTNSSELASMLQFVVASSVVTNVFVLFYLGRKASKAFWHTCWNTCCCGNA